jgi:type IV pilus assembly protein PilC
MPTYAYTAIEAGTGRECQGSIACDRRDLAAAALAARGLALTSLVSAPGPLEAAARPAPGASAVGPSKSRRRLPRRLQAFGLGRAIGRQELAVFTRQLATLLKAGMPLLRALEVLGRQVAGQRFRELIEGLAETIRTGGNLSDGLQRSPEVFDRLYVDMVKAGETGGVLATVLERLAQFLERTERIKSRVKTAMAYPVIILVVAAAILAGLMVYVVPKFEQIFNGMLKGQSLPPLTRAVLAAAHFVGHHFAAAAGVAVGLGIALRMFRRSRRGGRMMDGLLIRLPVLGNLLLKAAIARFSRTFGSLLASGVPMLDALVITRETSGNACVAEALATVHDRVREGATVASPLEAASVFPRLVTGMIAVGEETGALPPMLRQIADAYDDEVDQAVAALTATIEPFMIVLMAAVVGVIVIALFLPMVSIIQHLQ